MKYTFILIISILAFQVNAQKIVTTDWVVYSNHASKPSQKQVALPVLTQAKESIETEGEVTVNEGTSVTFRTTPKGFIHLNGQFQVQNGAFFQAHKAAFEDGRIEGRSTATIIQHELNLKSYPNPFVDQLFLTFQLEQAAEVNIFLFDATGRMVQQIAKNKQLDAGQQEVQINTQNFIAGVYHCQIIIDGEQYSMTVVKAE